ncbi:MAG: hypothetical protein MI674_04270 [Cytophagales bacterium]|nr:hypothetical protein [Cytophagales bacterium]
MLKIKKKLFPFYVKRLIKNNRPERVSVGFEKATTVGMLYTYKNKDQHHAILQFSRKLKAMGKKMRVFCYIEEDNTDYDYHFSSFKHHDIHLFGKIKDSQLNEFVNTSFDYLYFIDLTPSPILDYLLAKSKAKCRVGKFMPERAALFEIMVSLNEKDDIHNLMKQMLHYTALLK